MNEFTICFGIVMNVILLLFGRLGFCWREHVLSFRSCVCCVCDPNMSFVILLLCVYVRGDFSVVSEVSQLYGFLLLFLCCIFVVICSYKGLNVVCIVPLWNVMSVCSEYYFIP